MVISTIKTLSDWGVPRDELRQAYLLMERATLEELESSWIVHIEKRDVVSEDILRLGCEMLGIPFNEKRKAPDFPDDMCGASGEEELTCILSQRGAIIFEYDARRHFDYRLVGDPDELAELMRNERDGDCRVHNLRRHVEGVREAARAMGLPDALLYDEN
jgi:hypothetical protein